MDHIEQAESALDDGISGLAGFLSDTPEEPEHEGKAADNQPEDESKDTDDESAKDEQDKSEEDATDDPAPAPLRKVTVKGEDGADTEIEVSDDELVKGYQRQADYTRKTQELAERENNAVQVLRQKHDEISQQYIQQAEAARAMVWQLAGIKSQQEMLQLSQDDPAAWVHEQQRQTAIMQMLGNVDQSISKERQEAINRTQQSQQEYAKQVAERSWGELNKAGIDKPKLAGIYEDAEKAYGIPRDRLESIIEAKEVFVLRDALAFRALKDKAPQVTKQAKEAPRMPQKQNSPRNEQKDKAISQKFSNGRAKLNDLAAFLSR